MAKNAIVSTGALTGAVKQKINNNLRDIAYCTSSTTANTTTTLADVTGMVTEALKPGKYTFNVRLGTTANAAGGIKLAFKQSVSSMLSSIEYQAQAFAAAAVAASRGTSTTDDGSIVASTSAAISVVINGYVVVAKEGTLKLRMAQNASHASDTIVYVGSYMQFERIGD